MARIVVTAQVEDSREWEAQFRTHVDLFRSNNLNTIYYATTEDNEVATYSDVDDVDAYMAFMESDAIAQAMAEDGVKRETVKVYVLDKELPL